MNYKDYENRFKNDVLQANGLEGHPKADKIYSMAWEEGHSNGLTEVAHWVHKLAELVKENKKAVKGETN